MPCCCYTWVRRGFQSDKNNEATVCHTPSVNSTSITHPHAVSAFYMYDTETAPRSKAEWDATAFVDKNYVGWNVLSKQTVVYAGSDSPVEYVESREFMSFWR